MGKRGPKPTPTKILQLRGNVRAATRVDRGRNGLGEPGPIAGLPDTPDYLSPSALAMWEVTAKNLSDMGVLSKADGNVLARYCAVWARWKEVELFLQKHGQVKVVKDKEGNPVDIKAWPQVKIALNLALLLTRLEQELGLTPSARSRVALINEPDARVDAFAALMADATG